MDQKSRKIHRFLADKEIAADKAKDYFQDIMENSRDVLFRHNFGRGGVADYLSDSIEELTGYTVNEFHEKGLGLWVDNIHPDDRHLLMQLITECRNNTFSGSSSQMEYRYQHKDGHWIWIHDIVSIVRDNDGRIQAAIGVLRNITELKEQQQKCHASEQRFRRLAEAAFEAVAIHRNGSIVDVNQQYLEMFGYTLDEVKSIPGIEMIAPQSRQHVQEMMDSNYEGSYEAFARKKDGTIFPVLIRAKHTIQDGQPVRVGAIRDLSKQKDYEEKLHLANEKSRSLMKGITDPFGIYDTQGRCVFMNDEGLRRLGLPLDEVVGKHARELFGEQMYEIHFPVFQKVIETETSEMITGQIHAQGESRWYQTGIHPIRDAQGQISNILCISHDIHEERLLKQKVQDSENKYRQLYENAQVALFRTSMDGTLLQCNKACLPFFGYPVDVPLESYINTINVGDYYIDPKRRQEFIEALMENKRVEGFEAELKRADESTVWVSFSAEVFPEAGYIEGVLYNITVKKLLTKAERKVLRLLLQGLSNKQIARKLGRSVRTIEDHRAGVMRKLKVDNAFDLAKKTLNYNFDETAK